MKQRIQELAEEAFPKVQSVRRHLHSYPEVSMQEYQTSEYLCSLLDELGIPYTSGIADTGIVALIEGRNPSAVTIALRADMDALPIQEEKKVAYASLNKGVMHACGHDAHMASLIGCAMILQQLRDTFDGSLKLIFQPSEETFPGGAIAMIEEGVLKNPDVNMAFGQHVLPTLDAGMVGMRQGLYMASTDELFFTVKGKGGHGATPDLNIDPIVISAQIIMALQQLSSRYANPAMPTVVSIGKVDAPGRTNVIPDQVKMEGILRTFDEKWRLEAHKLIKKIAGDIASAMGGSCEVFVDKGYPALYNDPALTAHTFSLAQEYLGEDKVVNLDQRMTAEDFAYFAREVPSCFYRLGIRNISKGINSNLHTPTFDIDENALLTGMGLMAWLAWNNLQKYNL